MASQYGLITGDSFSDPNFNANTWGTQLLTTAVSRGMSGRLLTGDIRGTLSAYLTDRDAQTSYLVIQGGINDIISDVSFADMQTATRNMLSTARSTEGATYSGYLDIAVMGVAPFSGNVNWSSPRQTVLEQYNDWLATSGGDEGFTYINIYDPLLGSTTELAAAYDNGDGLHPNVLGYGVIAAAADSVISSFVNKIRTYRGAVEPSESSPSGNQLSLYKGAVEPSPITIPTITAPTAPIGATSTVNQIKSWRGAVEPAETSPSGNEIKLWRGAVEPAAPVSSASDALIGGVTRSVTRTLTRGVTEGWDWGA